MNNINTQQDQKGLILITEVKEKEIGIKSSQYCAKLIIQELVDISWEKIKLNKLYSRFLGAYSNMKTMSNMEEINTFIFSSFPFVDQMKKQEDEPVPLALDSLLPISAEIDQENPFAKMKMNKTISEETSTISRIKSKADENLERSDKYAKLQVTQISEQDGFTKELRKRDEQKNMKLQNERKIQQRKKQLLQEKLKDKKKNQKQQKFSYDYNGEVIEIKLESKANLVSKVINGLTNQKVKVNKEANYDSNPVQIEPIGRKKLLANLKRKDDVEFSDVKSLAQNIKANVGIKYTYEGKTYEEKQKAVSVMELRKTLSQRKISKEDYKKIRELNGNKKQYEDILKNINQKQQGRPQRAHSQAKRAQSRSTYRQKQKIHVSRNDLKGKLFEKNPEPEYLTQQNKEVQVHPESRLGYIDSFNLEYLKNGGILHTSTSKDFHTQRQNNELPKITHTTLYSKMKPKGRERIKDSNEIIRDLRKKFQEKLRV